MIPPLVLIKQWLLPVVIIIIIVITCSLLWWHLLPDILLDNLPYLAFIITVFLANLLTELSERDNCEKVKQGDVQGDPGVFKRRLIQTVVVRHYLLRGQVQYISWCQRCVILNKWHHIAVIDLLVFYYRRWLIVVEDELNRDHSNDYTQVVD